MRVPGSCLAIALSVLMAAPAAADPMAEAFAAVAVGDHAAARTALSAPELRHDTEALGILAGLMRDGLGGPVDLVEAYMLYSMVFQLAEPHDAMAAADERHVMAHDMTAAEIREAEARLVARVDEEIGETERRAQIAALGQQLRICDRGGPACEDVILEVLPFGPAAADLVPDIEDLMTQDPQWMPRELYSIALAMIGTSAVPALCRLLLDEREIASEGTWNAQVVAGRLGLLGEAAAGARPCLMKALARDYDAFGLARSEMVADLGSDAYEVVLDLKREIAGDLLDIGDRGGQNRDPLLYYFLSEPDLKIRLAVGWSYGLTYDDAGPVLGILPAALGGRDARAQLWALLILDDLSKTEGFAERARPLEPMVRSLVDSPDPGISEAARHALGVFAPQAP